MPSKREIIQMIREMDPLNEAAKHGNPHAKRLQQSVGAASDFARQAVADIDISRLTGPVEQMRRKVRKEVLSLGPKILRDLDTAQGKLKRSPLGKVQTKGGPGAVNVLRKVRSAPKKLSDSIERTRARGLDEPKMRKKGFSKAVVGGMKAAQRQRREEAERARRLREGDEDLRKTVEAAYSMRGGGKVKKSYKKGGSVKSIDGIAQRGKTRAAHK